MRLPNFLLHAGLTELKSRMGIAPDSYGQGQGYVVIETLSQEEREKLVSGEGIDVIWNELLVLQNGTFVFKGARVLLYIRDVHVLGDKHSEPRYHLTTCNTIEAMHAANRFTRYVVAQQPDGVFNVNLISRGGTSSERRRLSVCQHCLTKLAIDGFGYYMRGEARKRAVAQFTPEKFFALYPQSPHTKFPVYDADGAPLNDYTKDFPHVSRSLRERVGWKCQGCRRVFSERSVQRFLQVHHRNSGRWDNSPENLEVLCVGCHAEAPAHSHMKSLPIYREFKQRFS
jgi:hypothetical protein